jgi:hypothetical protein
MRHKQLLKPLVRILLFILVSSGSNLFAQTCTALSLPQTQGFNSTAIPSCWSTAMVQNQAASKISFGSAAIAASPEEGAQMVIYSSGSSIGGGAGSEERLISAPLSTSGLSGVDVELYWRNDNAGLNSGTYLNEGVQVQYSIDGGSTWNNAGNFIPRTDPALLASSSQWEFKRIALPNAACNQPSLLLAFKFHSELGYSMYLDNVTVKASACPPPTGVTVTNITTSSASISFTGSGNFIVEYGAPGFTPGSGSAAGGGTIITATSSPVILTGLVAGTQYDVYIRQNCSSSGNGFSNNTSKISFTTSCTSTVVPAVSISASATSICAGSSATFTATPVNGGNSPIYQWYIGSTPVGTNSSSFTYSAFNNGDVVTVQMISSLACASPTSATSNAITMTVNGSVTPSVSLSANPGTTICAGTNVTFTPTSTNGGSNPSYQWYVNNVATGTYGTRFVDGGLNNGDVVSVQMISNAGCASPASASASVTMTVNPNVTPSVSLSRSPSGSICQGTNITFTATPTNGGTSPSYQWKVGTQVQSATGATFSTSALNNGDQVTLTMTSNASCAVPPTASASNVLTIVSTLTPSVTITASSTSTCQGTAVTFTPTPTNGGTAPAYQWQVNGQSVSTGSAFTSSVLNNGDVVRVQMTSGAACASPASVNSNSITMNVSVCTAINQVDPDISDLKLIPNVVAGNTVLHVSVLKTTSIQWRIFDNSGKLVSSFVQQVHTGINDRGLYLGNLSGGLYYMIGASASGKVSTIPFFKQ